MSTNSIIYDNGMLSYVGQEAVNVPSVLWKLYGNKTICLDLSYNRLTNLKNLEYFDKLNHLILDNNQLDDSIILPSLHTVDTLSLNKNNITNLELLLTKINQFFPYLKYLSLLGNIACPNQLSDTDKDENDYQRYSVTVCADDVCSRYYVIYKIPTLRFLDSQKVTKFERYESNRCGKYMKISRPVDNGLCESPPQNKSKYKPLPSESIMNRKQIKISAIYGKCKYKYSGKHSEGNRFIRNSDL